MNQETDFFGKKNQVEVVGVSHYLCSFSFPIKVLLASSPFPRRNIGEFLSFSSFLFIIRRHILIVSAMLDKKTSGGGSVSAAR